MSSESEEEKKLRVTLKAEALRRAAKTQADALKKIQARTHKK